ncbi:MAG: class I SAM-dependent methyltransferase [Candidatus Omnitrophota bacterium]
MRKIHYIQKIIKRILYKIGLLNLFSKIQNRNFWILKNGYSPRKFWDNWSDKYFKQPHRKKTAISHEWLLEEISNSKPENILEVGCGFGRNLDFIYKNLKSPVKIIGLDLSEKFLKKALKYVDSNISLVCADIMSLPFSDNSIDFVFTYGTLMHVPHQNIKDAIMELRRICKKDLVIVEEIFPAGKNKNSLQLNDYTFIHRYTDLISETDLRIKEIKKDNDFIELIYLHCQKQ